MENLRLVIFFFIIGFFGGLEVEDKYFFDEFFIGGIEVNYFFICLIKFWYFFRGIMME